MFIDSEHRAHPKNRRRNAWLLDLLGRLIYAHQLDHEIIAAALNQSVDLICAFANGDIATLDVCPRLPLVVNIIIRAEMRLHGDSRAMRDMLTLPLLVLGNETPAARMAGSLGDLRQVRLAIDHITAPQERWWRTGHR